MDTEWLKDYNTILLNYKEFGYPDAPSILENAKICLDYRILAHYLSKGTVIKTVTEERTDNDGNKKTVIVAEYKSDGEYVWHSRLAGMVEYYRIQLPEDFYQKVMHQKPEDKEKYPILTSEFLEEESFLFMKRRTDLLLEPFERMEEDAEKLLLVQYLSKDTRKLFIEYGEKEVIDFLNRYVRWAKEQNEKKQESRVFTLSKEDLEEFITYASHPENVQRRKKPITNGEYLHLCRIAFDAAPRYSYPDFISDSYVIIREKMDSIKWTKETLEEEIPYDEAYPEFLWYHPEEMSFGGPHVKFHWNEEGWYLKFWTENRFSMYILRFLAMRRAGYPVVPSSGLDFAKQKLLENPNGYSFTKKDREWEY